MKKITAITLSILFSTNVLASDVLCERGYIKDLILLPKDNIQVLAIVDSTGFEPPKPVEYYRYKGKKGTRIRYDSDMKFNARLSVLQGAMLSRTPVVMYGVDDCDTEAHNSTVIVCDSVSECNTYN